MKSDTVMVMPTLLSYVEVSVNGVQREVTLANFGDWYVSSENVLAWGAGQYLRPIGRSMCDAIGVHYPHLQHRLRMNFMSIVALGENDGCAYSIEWKLSERSSHVLPFYAAWCQESWFAFERDDQPAL